MQKSKHSFITSVGCKQDSESLSRSTFSYETFLKWIFLNLLLKIYIYLFQ
jgi:hypothetical protein